MGGKRLVEVTEIITSTKKWIVPAGCKKVDAFIVAAGGHGGASIKQSIGHAGKGGTVLLQKGIPVVPGSSVNIIVGKSDGESSSFDSIIAQGANEPGESRKTGIACPFPDVPLAYSYKMGVHGGKGVPYPSSGNQNLGGNRGGGDGALAQTDPKGGAESGYPGDYYGAGGGEHHQEVLAIKG